MPKIADNVNAQKAFKLVACPKCECTCTFIAESKAVRKIRRERARDCARESARTRKGERER